MLLSLLFFSNWLFVGIVYWLLACVLFHLGRAVYVWARSEGVLLFAPTAHEHSGRFHNTVARRREVSDFAQVEAFRWFWGGPVLFYIVRVHRAGNRVVFEQSWLMLPSALYALVRHSIDAAAYHGHFLQGVYLVGSLEGTFQPPWISELDRCNKRGQLVTLEQNFVAFGPVAITIKHLLSLEYVLHDGDSEKIPARQMQALRLFTVHSGNYAANMPGVLRVEPGKGSSLVG